MFIGDSRLNYKKEQIFETFYSWNVYKSLSLSADYQRIANPGYNADRGPVNFYGLRAHIEMWSIWSFIALKSFFNIHLNHLNLDFVSTT